MTHLITALALATSVAAPPPDWETAFRQAPVGFAPVGPTRGTVLDADGRFPRMKARLQGSIWKGKTFHGDGTFTNRWVGGIRAGNASTHIEPSWLDGQPSLVVQYPSNALVFRNTRDEIRQVAPDVWLGRSFDATTGAPKNWFTLRAR
jgi:hypothetical protein